MKATIFEYALTVQETDLDFLGHVNNAKYLTFYEQARWDFIEKGGYGLSVMQKNQQSPIILEVDSLKFKRELSAREKVTVKSQLIEHLGKIMKIRQWMEKSDGKLASEMVMTIGFFDMKQRKLITPTQDWLKACGMEKAEM